MFFSLFFRCRPSSDSETEVTQNQDLRNIDPVIAIMCFWSKIRAQAKEAIISDGFAQNLLSDNISARTRDSLRR